MFIWSGSNEYVLRVYPQGRRTDADILRELDFMAYVRHGDLPVPAVIPSLDGEPLVTCDLDGQHWQCVLMERAPGEHLAALTPTLIDHMAHVQAVMHLLGERYAQRRTP